jgi:hypothetical protein
MVTFEAVLAIAETVIFMVAFEKTPPRRITEAAVWTFEAVTRPLEM